MAKSHLPAEFLVRWPYMAECDECGGEVQPRPPDVRGWRLLRRWVSSFQTWLTRGRSGAC